MNKKNKIALIFGPNGQDAYFLNKILIKNKIKIYGLTVNKKKTNFGIKKFYLKEFNEKSLNHILSKIKPDLIFNLFSISSKAEAENDILKCDLYNNYYNLVFLNVIKNSNLNIKYFLALSGLLFSSTKLSHSSKPEPILHPYSISKYSAYNYLRYFNLKHNMFCCSAFFFNHESKLRDGRFITRKIINKLKTTKQSKILEINNINDMIDWGHAEDYMNATLKIINLKKPSHHIIATGKNHSLKYFIELVCKFLNIRFKWKIINKKFCLVDTNKNEVLIKSNIKKNKKKININVKKIQKKLKWKPSYSFDDIVKEMCLN